LDVRRRRARSRAGGNPARDGTPAAADQPHKPGAGCRLGDEHIAHLVFIFDDDGQVEAREHQITFRPFTISELRKRLELAGLREIDTDFGASRDRYAVVTVTT
jgi:hypothetical protein